MWVAMSRITLDGGDWSLRMRWSSLFCGSQLRVRGTGSERVGGGGAEILGTGGSYIQPLK